MSDDDDLMAILRELRSLKHSPFTYLVDEAALRVARRCMARLGDHFDIQERAQIIATVQAEVAVALRHAVFDLPVYPG